MNKTKQWKVSGSESTTAIWVEDESGQRVCTVRNCEMDLDRANLIAAAPDLLEALQLCVARDESLKSNVTVMSAISRATGES
jgi:hypothetical protein